MNLSQGALPGTASAPVEGSGAMFDQLAGRYDRLNRILSWGLDRGWRRRAVDALALRSGDRILDLATGTGDVAIEIVRRASDVRVEGVDPSTAMLAIGRQKLERLGVAGRVGLRRGDAEHLPYRSESFDGATIAFGIRNVRDRSRGLREMARVTRRGGRVVVLELSVPQGGMLEPLARFHLRYIVPRLGAWLSNPRSYRYLRSSIGAFPEPEAFVTMMEEAGLEVTSVEGLSFGACHLYLSRSRGGCS